MPKAMQKTLLKLGIIGFVSLLIFNYPLLSLYSGYIGNLPVLYVLVFVLWLAVIFLAARVVEPDLRLFRRMSDRDIE